MLDWHSQLEVLRRVSAQLGTGRTLDELLQTITDGLVTEAGFASAVVSLFVADDDCPSCRLQPVDAQHHQPRLHQFALSRDQTYEFTGVHIVPLGGYFAGRAAAERRPMRFDDLIGALEQMIRDRPAGKPVESPELVTFFRRMNVQAGVFFPLLMQDQLVGTLSLIARRAIPDEEVELLTVFAQQAAMLIRSAQQHRQLEDARDRLAGENAYLIHEADIALGGMVATGPAIRQVLRLVRQVAVTEATVLITGETGTGKELVARAIHGASPRAHHPMVKLNCGAIAPTLVESELFGHERGAFTGATQRRLGRFELAHHGSLLLDEVGELPLEMQTRLLRVLQEREFERVGGERSIPVDVRVIASTHRDLTRDVADGRFREDLFYRLNVVPIHVPPLRERREDIPILAAHFVVQFAGRSGKPLVGISTASVERLMAYAWPGNIRELQNVIERACVLSPGPVVQVPVLTGTAGRSGPPRMLVDRTLRAVQREHVARVLSDAGHRIEGADGAAAILGLRPSTLRSLMHRLDIPRDHPGGHPR